MDKVTIATDIQKTNMAYRVNGWCELRRQCVINFHITLPVPFKRCSNFLRPIVRFFIIFGFLFSTVLSSFIPVLHLNFICFNFITLLLLFPNRIFQQKILKTWKKLSFIIAKWNFVHEVNLKRVKKRVNKKCWEIKKKVLNWFFVVSEL